MVPCAERTGVKRARWSCSIHRRPRLDPLHCTASDTTSQLIIFLLGVLPCLFCEAVHKCRHLSRGTKAFECTLRAVFSALATTLGAGARENVQCIYVSARCAVCVRCICEHLQPFVLYTCVTGSLFTPSLQQRCKTRRRAPSDYKAHKA